MDKKRWFTSKTLWLNTIVAALVALEANWGLLQPMLPVNFYTAIAVLLPVANAVLRVFSSKGVGL